MGFVHVRSVLAVIAMRKLTTVACHKLEMVFVMMVSVVIFTTVTIPTCIATASAVSCLLIYSEPWLNLPSLPHPTFFSTSLHPP